MATHSSILAWRIPWMEEPGLVGYSLWGHKELNTTENTHTHIHTHTHTHTHILPLSNAISCNIKCKKLMIV